MDFNKKLKIYNRKLRFGEWLKLVGVVKFVWNKKEKENEEGFRFGVL